VRCWRCGNTFVLPSSLSSVGVSQELLQISVDASSGITSHERCLMWNISPPVRSSLPRYHWLTFSLCLFSMSLPRAQFFSLTSLQTKVWYSLLLAFIIWYFAYSFFLGLEQRNMHKNAGILISINKRKWQQKTLGDFEVVCVSTLTCENGLSCVKKIKQNER